MKSNKFHVNFFMFLQITSTIGASIYRPCLSAHEAEGKCVPFDYCPPFVDILNSVKSGQMVAENLLLLQRLTCGFKNEDPMICCPVEGIIEAPKQELDTKAQVNLKPANREQSLRPHHPFSTDENPSKSEFSNEPSGKSPVSQNAVNLGYRSHKNFKLIPSLKDCSNTISSQRIVGGTEAGLASNPWMARIGYLNVETDEVEFYCGGTVINSRYILTAAHCTEEIDEEYKAVVVRLGEHDITTDDDCDPYIGCIKSIDYPIEKVIPHEDYQMDDKSNDIELIRVSREISFDSIAVRPICLPFTNEYGISNVWNRTFNNLSKPIKGVVAGWGRTKWNVADGSDTLQEIHLPLVPQETCQYNYSTRVEVSDKQICAGGIKHKDSCGGDSGGPLMYPLALNSDAKFFQLGIVSFGPVQCGQTAGLPGVYTSTKAYLQWILDNIAP